MVRWPCVFFDKKYDYKKISTHLLTLLITSVIVLLEQDEHLRRKAYEYQ